MSKVSLEIAKADVERWLDYKKLTQKKRDEKADMIETLTDLVSSGDITIDEECNIKHNLLFPVGEVKVLTYKPRLKAEAISVHLKGVSSDDMTGMIAAYAAALTVQPKSVIKDLDTEDFSIARAIAIFFI